MCQRLKPTEKKSANAPTNAKSKWGNAKSMNKEGTHKRNSSSSILECEKEHINKLPKEEFRMITELAL